jgi:flagellar hook assembly protein FlgD
VRVQILDAHGRRVAEGSGGAAGSWTWPGTDRDGRGVSSGIYFIRARDSAGQLSTRRVMIIH